MRIGNFDRDQVIAIYGIMQIELKKEGVLTASAVPIEDKGYGESIQDGLSLYKWLAEQLRHTPEHAINQRKGIFNDIVRGLEQEYLLNMSLMAIFMLEYMIGEDGNTPQKIIIMPKVNRLIKHLRAGIIKEQEPDGLRIVKDSKIGASNIMRVFNGGYELTKEMRSWKAEQWRKAAQGAENENH